jgi:formylmethanofuran dehydrogenase subunit E
MKFNDDIPSNVKLTRWDTGKSVEVFYNHNVIAGNPLQQQLMQKIMQNIATDDERKMFGQLWQERVENIFNNIDKVIEVKEVDEDV